MAKWDTAKWEVTISRTFSEISSFTKFPENLQPSQQLSYNCIDVSRALEADSRSLHSLSSQHRRLSPGSSDPAAVCDDGLSRGDSMSSLVSGASLGSFTSSSQPTEDCELNLSLQFVDVPVYSVCNK